MSILQVFSQMSSFIFIYLCLLSPMSHHRPLVSTFMTSRVYDSPPVHRLSPLHFIHDLTCPNYYVKFYDFYRLFSSIVCFLNSSFLYTLEAPTKVITVTHPSPPIKYTNDSLVSKVVSIHTKLSTGC
jgi:hypothetical protein